MRVWIAKGYWAYEGSDILGVYSSQEKADARTARQQSEDDYYDGYIVKEYEIDIDGEYAPSEWLAS